MKKFLIVLGLIVVASGCAKPNPAKITYQVQTVGSSGSAIAVGSTKDGYGIFITANHVCETFVSVLPLILRHVSEKVDFSVPATYTIVDTDKKSDLCLFKTNYRLRVPRLTITNIKGGQRHTSIGYISFVKYPAYITLEAFGLFEDIFIVSYGQIIPGMSGGGTWTPEGYLAGINSQVAHVPPISLASNPAAIMNILARNSIPFKIAPESSK